MITQTDNMITETHETRPNKAYDIEYMTEWKREVEYLASKGINYTFVKKTKDYGVKQYKYTKTPELFLILAEFYNQVAQEKKYSKLEKMLKTGNSIPNDLQQQFARIVMKDCDPIG